MRKIVIGLILTIPLPTLALNLQGTNIYNEDINIPISDPTGIFITPGSNTTFKKNVNVNLSANSRSSRMGLSGSLSEEAIPSNTLFEGDLTINIQEPSNRWDWTSAISLLGPNTVTVEGKTTLSVANFPSSYAISVDEGSSLILNGAANIKGTVSVDGGDLIFNGEAKINGNIDAESGKIEFNDQSVITGNIDAAKHGIIEFNGKTTIDGEVATSSKTGLITFNDTSEIGSINTEKGSIIFNGESKINDGITIEGKGKVAINNQTKITGDINVSDKNSLLLINGESEIDGDINIEEEGKVEINSKTNIIGDINVSDQNSLLLITGESEIDGDINIEDEGKVEINSKTNITGDINVSDENSLLLITGESAINGEINIEDQGKIEINNKTNINGDINVLDENSLLLITGEAVINGNIEALENGTVKLNLASGSKIKGGANNNIVNNNAGNILIALAKNASWDITNNKSSITELSGSGNVKFINANYSNAFGELTIADLKGEINFDIRSDIVAENSDKIIVTRSAEGNHTLNIVNNGASNTNGQESLIIVEIKGTNTAKFITTHAVELGGYVYNIYKHNNNWVLTSSLNNPTDPVTPDNPTSPVSPDNPTDPISPDNPTNPISSNDPTDPVSPDNPTSPVSPDNPTDPISPDNPTNPISSNDPTDPVSPDNPTSPVSPDNPTDPVSPDNPTSPVSPDNPTDPVSSNDPTDPVNPENSTNPVTSNDSTDPVSPDNPTNQVHPDIPTTPVNAGKPIKPQITTTANASAGFLNGNYLMSYVETQTLLKRLGDIRNGGEFGNVWLRGFSGKLDSFASGKLSKFDMNYHGFQFGADKELSEYLPFVVGAFVGQTYGDPNYRKGDGSLRSFNIGLYTSYFDYTGFYIDVVGKFARQRNHFKVKDTANNYVQGSGHTDGLNLSMELGKKFIFRHFYIEPQTQLSYSHQNGTSINATNGLRVKLGNYNSLIGRASALFGYEVNTENSKFNLYAKTGIVREFNGDTYYKLNNSKESHSFKGNWWNNGVGISAQINHKHTIYFDLESSLGNKFDLLQVNGGYRYSF